ncbi:hypothetical protein [Helicobacter jaachi]
MKKVILLVSVVMACLWAEELQLHEPSKEIANPTENLTKNNHTEDTKASAQVSKNLSIKADLLANEGYSELELTTGNANPNEIEAPMSRYSAGVELNYSVKPDSNVEVEFFASNALEINAQRRGGKTKAYDSGQQYEENAYDYGSRILYPAWVNSIGMAVTVSKAHRFMLTFKQTQISVNDALMVMGGGVSQPVAQTQNALNVNNEQNMTNAPVVTNVPASNKTMANPYALTTQIFLTYSYIF